MSITGFVSVPLMAQTPNTSEKKPFGIVIHGGAGAPDKQQMTKEKEAEYHAKLKEALQAGHTILERGGTSLDAVAAAITIMEDSPLFNAGKGAVLNFVGHAELDASIMDGSTSASGAVAGVKETKNPILLARAVMEKTSHVMLAGEGTDLFAREQGLPRVPNEYFITDRRREAWQRLKDKEKENKTAPNNKTSDRSDAPQIPDSEETGFGTVGAVALDRDGNLAAGTSTGGRLNKMVGRVGDSPIIGAGNYANNKTCAVSGTGHGEYFIRTVAAHTISVLMEHRQRDVKTATETVLREIETMGGSGGIIAIDKEGRVALPFNTPGMYRGYQLNGAEANVAIW
ncbi:MAG: isoaspartyl peptidase/L-asparaginase [Verrucomicrobia bacterium]|nr:isoaspartyl peptidase/L-asparaginase [Verrucomicrobiota bacterium]